MTEVVQFYFMEYKTKNKQTKTIIRQISEEKQTNKNPQNIIYKRIGDLTIFWISPLFWLNILQYIYMYKNYPQD